MLRLGADELYGGLAAVPNHRLPAQSFSSVDEIVTVIKMAARRGRRFSLLLNQPSFGDRFARSVALVKRLDAEGLGACIVRELAMLDALSRAGLKARLTASSLALCYNLPSMRRLKEMGATRVVLPFHMAPDEARRLIANPFGMETEVFFHADFCCANVDPVCRLWNLTHRDQTCRFSYTGPDGRWRMPEANAAEKMRSVYRFHHSGAGYLKIIRMNDFRDEMEVLKFSRLLTALLEKGTGEADFVRMCLRLYSTVTRHAWIKR